MDVVRVARVFLPSLLIFFCEFFRLASSPFFAKSRLHTFKAPSLFSQRSFPSLPRFYSLEASGEKEEEKRGERK